MNVRGSIPRSPTSILRDISRLQKELHLRASIDPKFKAFIYESTNYPFRVLGFTSAANDIDEVAGEWENIKLD
jgi:hypothetical protein